MELREYKQPNSLSAWSPKKFQRFEMFSTLVVVESGLQKHNAKLIYGEHNPLTGWPVFVTECGSMSSFEMSKLN
jgi:hypothetical protein